VLDENLTEETITVQTEQQALEEFFYDYSFSSKNNLLSRGFLQGIESVFAHAEPSSDIAMACKVAAFASFGRKWQISSLVMKAEILYSNLLHSFRMTITNSVTSNTAGSLVTAVLLGLYEVRTGFKVQCGISL
jgi:hypothetical protein